MKGFYFFLSRLFFLQFILLQSIIGKTDSLESESFIKDLISQKQFIACQGINEIEYLSIFEDCEEEQDQFFTILNLFQKKFLNHFNCSALPVMEKHIQNIILFESDNSPPFITKA